MNYFTNKNRAENTRQTAACWYLCLIINIKFNDSKDFERLKTGEGYYIRISKYTNFLLSQYNFKNIFSLIPGLTTTRDFFLRHRQTKN